MNRFADANTHVAGRPTFYSVRCPTCKAPKGRLCARIDGVLAVDGGWRMPVFTPHAARIREKHRIEFEGESHRE